MYELQLSTSSAGRVHMGLFHPHSISLSFLHALVTSGLPPAALYLALPVPISFSSHLAPSSLTAAHTTYVRKGLTMVSRVLNIQLCFTKSYSCSHSFNRA